MQMGRHSRSPLSTVVAFEDAGGCPHDATAGRRSRRSSGEASKAHAARHAKSPSAVGSEGMRRPASLPREWPAADCRQRHGNRKNPSAGADACPAHAADRGGSHLTEPAPCSGFLALAGADASAIKRWHHARNPRLAARRACRACSCASALGEGATRRARRRTGQLSRQCAAAGRWARSCCCSTASRANGWRGLPRRGRSG